jgi:hypothetical protein
MNKNKNLTILYLHGLESKLSLEKRAVLERYGKVISPDLDYFGNSKIFSMLTSTIKIEYIDIIIGSSMGGFMGYYLSNTWNKPALLFNPALSSQPVRQEINFQNSAQEQPPKLILVLGKLDCIVNPNDTLQWLAQNQKLQARTKIKVQNNMEHQIPLSIFEEEIIDFFTNFYTCDTF